jgi:hypothetical protein
MATLEIKQGSVETLQRVLSYLVVERQQLRAQGSTPVELEANRRSIVAMQWQLDRALGERYGSPPKTPARTS